MLDRSAMELRLMGYRLATAEITYRMPDHPAILQIFVWQHYDLALEFPRLKKFLDYWRDNIEGELHSVAVTRARSVKPNSIRRRRKTFTLH
jgi:uncharacterized protein Usg